MIIGITGMPLAGKAKIRKIFEDLGCPTFIMRTVVEDEAKKQGQWPMTNESLREFATNIRKEKGRGVVAELCIPHLRKMLETEDMIIVDGLRSPEEPTIFKKEFGDDFVLLCVWAPFRLRALRLARPDSANDPREAGHASSDPKTVDELKWRDQKELSWGLGEVIAQADYLITNMTTKEDLESNVKKFLRTTMASGMKKISDYH